MESFIDPSTRAWRLAGCALALAACLPALAEPKREPKKPPEILGQIVATPPAPTEAGTWDGTWYYGNRDVNVALWMRTVDGGPQIKLRTFNRTTGEGFETDWNAQASYIYDGWPGTFALDLTARSATRFAGAWVWELRAEPALRTETASVSAWRAGDGRQLVMKFDGFTRAYASAKGPHEVATDFFWTFRKASTRLSLWDELPF